MLNLQRTRVAVAIAAVMAVPSGWAPGVSAGTVTIDWPACASPKLTGTGPYTISCGGSACTASATIAGAPVNPAVAVAANSTVSLNVQCSPTAATASNTTWIASRDCASPSSGLPASVSDAGKLCTYSANVSANGETMRADVSVLWSAGSVTPPPPPPPPPPTGLCSQFTDVRRATLGWIDQLATQNVPAPNTNIAPGTVYVLEFTVPSTATAPLQQKGSVEMVEWGSVLAVAQRVVSLSTQPCDFRGYSPPHTSYAVLPTDPTGTNNPVGWAKGNAVLFTYALPGTPQGWIPVPVLQPGKTYYFNIQTIVFESGANACTSSSFCNMKITPRPPQ